MWQTSIDSFITFIDTDGEKVTIRSSSIESLRSKKNITEIHMKSGDRFYVEDDIDNFMQYIIENKA